MSKNSKTCNRIAPGRSSILSVMSFRKTRVHLTGKSNADGRTGTVSPMRTRPALHEKPILNASALILTQGEDPIGNSILKYKTWNKKLKTKSSEGPRPDFQPKHDPPDFTNVKQKVESLRAAQTLNSFSDVSMTEQFLKFVKKTGVGIKSQFIKVDKSKKGLLSLQEFKEVLENVNAPKGLVNNTQKLFEELGGNSEGLDYKKVTKSFLVTDVQLPQIVNQERFDSFRVIDKKVAPPNQLENIFNYGKRLRQFLKSCYKSPEHLVADLSSNNDRVSLNSLKDFVLSKLSEDSSLKITQRELEGFLASYDYNKDSDTSAKEVAKYVFLDDLVAANYLHIKKRAIPPLREPGKVQDLEKKRLKKLLLDIEHKVFTQGPSQTLPAFKMFDRDNDGFITLEDVEHGLTLAQVPHTAEDTEGLFRFLDDNSNGFVTFTEFSKVIQPNIITVNRAKLQESEEQHLNISQPSTTFYVNQKNKLPEPPSAFFVDAGLKVPTRYSSSPPFQNTFSSFAPTMDSAMFLPDKERYSAKKFEPTNLHHEDKQRVRKVAEAKAEYLRKSREIQENRVREIEAKELKLDSQKIVNRARVKGEYEVKCKMGMIS